MKPNVFNMFFGSKNDQGSRSKTGMVVFVYPGPRGIANPYIAMLMRHLAARGDINHVNVLSCNNVFSYLNTQCIIHFQWIPEHSVTRLGYGLYGYLRWLRIYIAYFVLLGLVFLRKVISPTRVVWTLHDAPRLYVHAALIALLRAFHFSLADGYIIHAEAARRDIPLRHAHKPVVFCDRPNFIGYYGLMATNDEASDARRKINLPGDAVIFFVFGLLRRYKNIEKIISAFISAKEIERRVHLLIVGVIHDSDVYQKIQKLSDVEPNIVLIPREIPESDVRLLFGISDYVVIGQERGYTSAVMFAALSYARPVIILKWGAASQYIENGKNGFFFDWDNLPKVMTEAVRRRLAGAEYYKMCDAAYKTVEPLTWDRAVDSMTGLYSSLFSSRTAG